MHRVSCREPAKWAAVALLMSTDATVSLEGKSPRTTKLYDRTTARCRAPLVSHRLCARFDRAQPNPAALQCGLLTSLQ
jgi:hypothetical protein